MLPGKPVAHQRGGKLAHFNFPKPLQYLRKQNMCAIIKSENRRNGFAEKFVFLTKSMILFILLPTVVQTQEEAPAIAKKNKRRVSHVSKNYYRRQLG
jgi:hypothetical protein